MSVKNKKPGRAWLIAKRVMAAVLVILGAAAIFSGEKMKVRKELWAVARW